MGGGPGDGPADARASWAEGTGDVRTVDGAGSALQVVYANRRWHVPLERPVRPAHGHTSPAGVMDARSGVVPYVDLGGRLAAVSAWIGGAAPFKVALLAGGAGEGKTRLAVEMCRLTTGRRWLSGMLRHSVDKLGLADLADTPAPRLVVVDGGENRRSQLEVVLPTLRLAASASYPLRVVVLLRSVPGQTGMGRGSLPVDGGADVDAILRAAAFFDLGDHPASAAETTSLFAAAATAFAHHVDGPRESATWRLDETAAGEAPIFTTVRALLRANSRADVPRPDLIEGLLRLEEESWTAAPGPFGSQPQFRRRVVALAALAGARGENEAAQLLSALPELAHATRQERQRLARWVHTLYPGPLWWNPLARGLLAEHLVAGAFRDLPDVIGAILDRRRPESLVQPLALLAHICSDDSDFAETARPVVSAAQDRLRRQAASQAAEGNDVHALLSGTTLADVLERSLDVIGRVPDRSRDDIY